MNKLIKYKVFSLLISLFLFNGCQNTSIPIKNVKTTKSNHVEISDSKPISAEMVLIKGGDFLMGSNDEMENESPVHKVSIKSFLMDRNEVTVKEFEEFVKATNYLTEAEKFGWSAVFDLKIGEWKRVDGANWQNPDGEGQKPLPNEPVTQISWNDANKYAKWAGKRLPSEAEWEFSARGGLSGKKYAWGDTLRPNGVPVANWWQGSFPAKNTLEDDFLKRSPVGSFESNSYGLHDMAGNVWEWTSDWYDDAYYHKSPINNPKGVDLGTERSIRGGSWMCAENFCSNYRVAARSQATPDSAMNNLGFRCVKDISNEGH